MNDSFRRILAIVRADFLLRFRRPSTLIVFLLLSAFAYVWVPDPSTGRTLLQINGQRAIYNSAALGMATASVGMIFVGLFGFYVISNAIRRDVVTRCGLVAASTSMRSLEYLLGKFLGNVAFLTTFIGGFMLSSMAMQLVRGEAAFEPLVFVHQYLLLTPPTVIFVSAIAVLFEAIPWLSGKLGDVVYFFVFMASVGIVVSQVARSGGQIGWGRYVDVSGFGFMIEQMQQTMHTESVSIGASEFDPTKPTIVFHGLTLPRSWMLPRIVSMLFPLAFIPLAALFFHRFDPVRTRRTSEKGKRNWLGRIQMLFKPLTRRAVALLLLPARGGSLINAIWTDAVLTLTLSPFAFLAFVGVSIAAVVSPPFAVLPFAFLALAIFIADVVTRDPRAGTTAIIYSSPRLRENLVWWKLGSTCVLSLLFCAVPLAMSAGGGWPRLATLVGGVLFVGACATALGVITQNAKTFIVGFLSFWYVVVNDHGVSPALDFAGFYRAATFPNFARYAILSILIIGAGQMAHRWRLARA